MTDHPIADHWAYPLTRGQTLSNHDWIPFHVNRFLTSELLGYAIAEGRRGDVATALVLWCESFKQDPAGSLPDDDILLAQLARMSLAEWREARAVALHGWSPVHVEGMDEGARQRLGHEVIAGIALDMHRRKAGRDTARDAARVANLRYKVRSKLKALGYRKHIWDSQNVVEAVAAFLDNARLNCTDQNLHVAMQEAVGVPRAVTALEDVKRRADGGESEV